MAILSLNPQYPLPNRPVNITINAEHPDTNYFRIWVTVSPTGSSLDAELKRTLDPRNRIEVYANTGGSDFPLTMAFDKGGKYTFVIQEYIKGSGYGGGFEGDPNSSDQEVNNGPEYTRYVYIGQKLTQSIGPTENQATLNVWVWDNSIRSTYRTIHGEDTPSIVANQPNDRINGAIESTSVKNALSALNGVAVSTAIGDFNNFVQSFFNKWNYHLADSVVHIDSDSANQLNSSLSSSYTPNTVQEFIQNAISRFKNHLSNDNSFNEPPTPPIGPGKANYHSASDSKNTSIFGSVSGLDEAYSALVDLYRCYDIHRADNSIHSVTDLINVLPTISPLMLVHKEFHTIISSANPPVPAAQSTGAQLLISKAGFKEV